jgi:hypothetical protein
MTLIMAKSNLCETGEYRYDLKFYEDGKLVQLLRSWTSSIFSFLV